MTTNRVEAFSDGVIAIAITLLVLEIHVPQVEDASSDALWRALAGLWPSYLGYVIIAAPKRSVGTVVMTNRPPYHLKTRFPGVFAVGDVGQRALAHVASAVGAGATAIAVIHEYPQERPRTWWSST